MNVFCDIKSREKVWSVHFVFKMSTQKHNNDNDFIEAQCIYKLINIQRSIYFNCLFKCIKL